MSKITEDKLADVGKWYNENSSNCRDPLKRMSFCMRGMWHILWLLTYIIVDIQALEHRKNVIELPVGALLDEPLRVDEGYRYQYDGSD